MLFDKFEDFFASDLIFAINFNNRSKSLLLATKVRYEKNDRFVAVMVIHE